MKVVNYKVTLWRIARSTVHFVENMVISLTTVSSRSGLMNNVFLREIKKRRSTGLHMNIDLLLIPHLKINPVIFPDFVYLCLNAFITISCTFFI